MGFIGVGNRGTQLLHSFMNNQDVEVTALCDIYKPYLSRDFSKVDERYKEMGMVPIMGENFGKNVKKYKDYRELLEDKNVDRSDKERRGGLDTQVKRLASTRLRGLETI